MVAVGGAAQGAAEEPPMPTVEMQGLLASVFPVGEVGTTYDSYLAGEYVRHYERYSRGEEDIGDYPYLAVLLSLCRAAGQTPPEQIWRYLLEAGADVNASMEDGSTPLHLLAYAWDAELCRVLLAAGAKVQARNAAGATPLCAAAYCGNAAFCRALLAEGAEVNAADARGDMPLFYAAVGENTAEACRVLLEGGADVLAKNNLGDTALLCSVDKANGEVARLLLEAGADATVLDDKGRTIFCMAQEEFCFGICRELVRADKVEEPLPPLLKAVILGHVDELRALLAAGADADAASPNGMTALSWAICLYEDEMTNLLLAAGADVNRVDSTGLTPLFYAVIAGDEGACVRLLAAGAAVNDREGVGASLLSIAVEQGMVNVCRRLLEAGVQVNEVSRESECSALHMAAQSQVAAAELCRLLLEAGAAVDAPDGYGFTPLFYADGADVCRVLLEAGADPNPTVNGGWTPLIALAWAGRYEACMALLEAGARPESRLAGDGRDAATCAFEQGWYALACALVAKVDSPSPALSPLAFFLMKHMPESELFQHFLFVQIGMESLRDYPYVPEVMKLLRQGVSVPPGVVQELLEGGAHVHECDPETRETALHMAAAAGATDICVLLLNAGADASATDAANRTPADLARAAGHPETAQAIMNDE